MAQHTSSVDWTVSAHRHSFYRCCLSVHLCLFCLHLFLSSYLSYLLFVLINWVFRGCSPKCSENRSIRTYLFVLQQIHEINISLTEVTKDKIFPGEISAGGVIETGWVLDSFSLITFCLCSRFECWPYRGQLGSGFIYELCQVKGQAGVVTNTTSNYSAFIFVVLLTNYLSWLQCLL